MGKEVTGKKIKIRHENKKNWDISAQAIIKYSYSRDKINMMHKVWANDSCVESFSHNTNQIKYNYLFWNTDLYALTWIKISGDTNKKSSKKS